MAVRCPNCGSTQSRFAFEAKDYEHAVPGSWKVNECTACGLFYLSPQPREEELPGFYPSTYSAYGAGSPVAWLFDFVYWLDARQVLRLIGQAGNILDVGCGDGSALAKLRSHGEWKLSGLEFDAAAAERAQKRGLDVRAGDLGSTDFPEASFDLIRMGHVIEHVLDPVEAVQKVFKLLKPGGYFVGETPNTDCVDFRLFGRYWGALHVPRHVTFFNNSNLRGLLATGGFASIELIPRMRTVGWSCGIQNFLVDKAGIRVPPSGRVPWYLILILPFLPVTFLQSLVGRTASVGFVARKPLV